MRRVFGLLIVVMFLTSCETNESELRGLIKESNYWIEDCGDDTEAQILKTYFERIKNKSYYVLFKKADSVYYNFMRAYDSHLDSNVSFSTLQDIYQTAHDSIVDIISFTRGYDWIDSCAIKYPQMNSNLDHSFVSTHMRLLRNYCLRNIYVHMVPVRSGPSYDPYISDEVIEGQDVSFNLNSFFLETNKKKRIRIDTVLHNGKLVKLEHTDSLIDCYNIKYDGLDEGKYDLRGKLVFYGPGGHRIEERFTHSFKVE